MQVADAPLNRKRRASPVSEEVQPAAKKAVPAPQAAAPSSDKDASKVIPSNEWESTCCAVPIESHPLQPLVCASLIEQEFEPAEWKAVAEEMGWTPLDCLQHKITFTKRADAKTKIDSLATHMKHLRLAGWMLQTELER